MSSNRTLFLSKINCLSRSLSKKLWREWDSNPRPERPDVCIHRQTMWSTLVWRLRPLGHLATFLSLFAVTQIEAVFGVAYIHVHTTLHSQYLIRLEAKICGCLWIPAGHQPHGWPVIWFEISQGMSIFLAVANSDEWRHFHYPRRFRTVY